MAPVKTSVADKMRAFRRRCKAIRKC